MSIIQLVTRINAPRELVFDLSRSVDVHMASTKQTNETVVAGRTTGLCETGDRITWRARHFGIYQQLTVEIALCVYPKYFEDRMIKGAFNSFTHKHYFQEDGDATVMHDRFEFKSPFGILGNLVNRIYLRKYMQNLLLIRNETIKSVAEKEHQLNQNLVNQNV
jgi:ligand-binding SRPBCC domain-containing protein